MTKAQINAVAHLTAEIERAMERAEGCARAETRRTRRVRRRALGAVTSFFVGDSKPPVCLRALRGDDIESGDWIVCQVRAPDGGRAVRARALGRSALRAHVDPRFHARRLSAVTDCRGEAA